MNWLSDRYLAWNPFSSKFNSLHEFIAFPESDEVMMDTPYTQWITTQLSPLGERVKYIELIRNGHPSAVFAVLTNANRYYFKTCGALFSHEPQLAAALGSEAP